MDALARRRASVLLNWRASRRHGSNFAGGFALQGLGSSVAMVTPAVQVVSICACVWGLSLPRGCQVHIQVLVG